MPERDRQLNIRVTPSELQMLSELAESFGLSQSDVVRQLIRNAHEERVKPSSKARRPKKEKRLL